MRLALTSALAVLLLGAACGTEPTPDEGPRVDEVVPLEAAVGATLVLYGEGLGQSQGESFVSVHGVPAAVAAWSDTRVQVEVPEVAAGQTVVVVTRDGSRSAPVAFTVLPR